MGGKLAWILVFWASMSVSGIAADDPVTVNNSFYQSDLRQAIEDVAAQAGVNIIVDPTVQGVVTVNIENSSVEKALSLLLAGSPYRVQKTEDYFLVYSIDAKSDLLTSVAKTKIVHLKHISPEAARNLLAEPLHQYVRFESGSGTRIAITAPPELMKRILDDLAEIDQPSEVTQYITLKHIGALEAQGLLPENLQVFVRADASKNIVAVTASPQTAEDIREQLSRMDVPGVALSLNTPDVHPTRIVKLNHVPVASLLAILPGAVTDYVRADETSNTLSVTAPENVTDKIMESVKTFDVPRQHIMLEARIVVMDKSDLLSFGGEMQTPTIQAGFNRASGTGNQYDISVGYLRTQVFTNALSLTLNLLSQNDEATIVANPQVLAQDGIPAEIRVTREEYIRIDSDSTGLVRGQLEKIETGTILQITPSVGANGVLTLKMDLEVSDVIARGSQGLPVVSRRTAKSTVQLENGGTATIAGLVDSRTQMGGRGMPGSKSLPLIGRVFRTDNFHHDARQVAIFVTATLVDADGNRLNPRRPARIKATNINEDDFRELLRQELIKLGEIKE